MLKRHLFVHRLTQRGFRRSVLWSVFFSLVIIFTIAALGRAAHNLQAALTEKPDIAIYLLLEDVGIEKATLLRESEDGRERNYLATTKSGEMLVILRRGDTQWEVAHTERLRR